MPLADHMGHPVHKKNLVPEMLWSGRLGLILAPAILWDLVLCMQWQLLLPRRLLKGALAAHAQLCTRPLG